MSSNYETELQRLETTDKKAFGRLKATYKSKLKLLSENEYLQELEANLNIETNHLMVINSIISMFYTCKNLGYQYFSVDPVFEINNLSVKNFDILFVKYESNGAKIILVEVKSSLANIRKEIKDFETTKEVYKNNKTIFEEFVGETIIHEDFVFAVPISYKDDIVKSISQNFTNIQEFILWSVDSLKSRVSEIKQSADHAIERTAKRVHLYSELDPLFAGQEFTNANPLSFTPLGNIIHILQFFYTEIYHKLKKDKINFEGNNYDFHIDLLKVLVSSIRETDNHYPEHKDKIIKLVLDFGVQYNILKKINQNEYRLKFTNKPYAIKEVLCKEHVNQKMIRDAEKSALEDYLINQKYNQQSLFNF